MTQLLNQLWNRISKILPLNQPKYKDCPYCHTVMRANRSICPACAKYVITPENNN